MRDRQATAAAAPAKLTGSKKSFSTAPMPPFSWPARPADRGRLSSVTKACTSLLPTSSASQRGGNAARGTNRGASETRRYGEPRQTSRRRQLAAFMSAVHAPRNSPAFLQTARIPGSDLAMNQHVTPLESDGRPRRAEIAREEVGRLALREPDCRSDLISSPL
jgi:hypothetical protein